MKKLTLIMAVSGLVASCGSSEGHGDENNTDSTEVTVDTLEGMNDEMSEGPTYDGEDRGDYTLYGITDISAEGNEIAATDMMAGLATNGDYEGKVSVTIDEVCQKAGCWITFQNGEEGSVRVFFKDHFTIPIETAQGTEAILYGRTVSDTLSVDFQKHLLDDAKEAGDEVSQADYDAITEDKIETTFEADAILVKK